MSFYDIDEVKFAAKGQWAYILSELFGINASFLRKKHGECPACGGRDRFRFDDKNGSGSYFCNGCGAGDGFSLAMKVNNDDFYATLKAIASEFRLEGIVRPVSVQERVTEAYRLSCPLDAGSLVFKLILEQERESLLNLSIIDASDLSTLVNDADKHFIVSNVAAWFNKTPKTHYRSAIQLLARKALNRFPELFKKNVDE